MAYIDRDKLIERIVSTPSKCFQLQQTIPFLNGSAARQNEIINLIEAEPAFDIIVPQYGHWTERIDEDDDPLFRRKFVCSACCDWQTYGMTQYCPSCGAKMRKG